MIAVPDLLERPTSDGPRSEAVSPSTSVPVRRISFDEALATAPRYFASDEDLLDSHLAVALSTVFPDGEDFFVRSVRHYRDRVEDPELRRQIAGFIGQESVHGREHRIFNRRMAEVGYPTKEGEWITRTALEWRTKLLPASANLAATAGLEHFTATIAEVLLTSEEARGRFGDDAVRHLFLWHALEESEHKAVAFDVYEHVGGTYPRRVLAMVIVTVRFLTQVAWMKRQLMKDDPNVRAAKGLEGLRVRLQSTWTLWGNPGWFRKLVPAYLDYYRPGFHPWDRDTTEALARARAKLGFDPEGREAVDDGASAAS